MFKRLRAQIKGIFDAKLPFEILEEFSLFEQKYLEEKGTLFPTVNNNKVVYDLKIKNNAKIALIMAIVFFVCMITLGFVTDEGFIHPVPLVLIPLTFLIILYYIHEIYINRHEVIILDRENGLITFPVGLRQNKVYTSPFNKIKIHWYGTGGATGNLDMKLVANHPDKKGGTFLEGLDRNYRKLWSFYVWYMDKNRPLPPGSAFDPYREADYERRKAEGFPKPLYRSHIPTHEATPEQQAERDRHWKDQLEEFTREPESVMYDPEIHKNWTEIRYVKQNKEPFANIFWRYEFENGDIIYMKTDGNGSGHEPPETEKYTTRMMDLFESIF
ncbi:hypothetical protein [Saccharicrinis aurantiacus]|uniref:hypothetical protein n=1 Tax=Saccharicrinis aurantiacus TaxID=1849719 RepID=UPI002492BDDE|nr:hypothetical protein [Saccharicrinis aurantiacus]